jgi:uncharacterized protein (DUF302 family)
MTGQRSLKYGFQAVVPVEYDRAVELTREALADRGFGVLTQIDVRATLKKKLDAEFRPYVILGACNPPLAHRALEGELPIGLLLPCNVIVYAGDERGTSVVAVLDPVVQLGLTGRDDMEPVAAEVRSLLQQVLEQVRESAAAPQLSAKGN